MMRSFCSGLVIGLCLTACHLQASEVPAPQPFSDQNKVDGLRTQFEQELKTQLTQKNIDDYSFQEISDLALTASKKVYGAHPQLMKQKALFDLQQMPTQEAQILSKYQIKESHSLRDLERDMSSLSQVKSEQSFEDVLPLFYGRTPEDIALRLKQMIQVRHISPKQMGQQAIISQFIPDKTYRIKASDPPQLMVKTFQEDLFIITVEITESGLLKPIQMEWMQPKSSKSS